MSKKQLGQFFTQKADHILQGLEPYIRGKKVVDPFAGGGDLMNWAKEHGALQVKGFDVDPVLVGKKGVLHNDSLLSPRKYSFVITNPPYLNVNKADNETKSKYFQNPRFEDLYRLSLAAIMDSEEGIIIVPINFLSAHNARKIRNLFFSKFEIDQMNYFREQVFPDTTYNVIALHYKKKHAVRDMFSIKTRIFPGNERTEIRLQREFDWTIGGEDIQTIMETQNVLGVRRLTEFDVEEHRGSVTLKGAHNHIKTAHHISVASSFADKLRRNILLLYAIDSGSEEGKVGLRDARAHKIEYLVSKETSRHMIQLIFEKEVPVKKQERLLDLFNEYVEQLRKKHLSLFLTNYRDNDRKRISFDFAYKLVNYLYLRHVAPQTSTGRLFFYESMGQTKYKTRERVGISR